MYDVNNPDWAPSVNLGYEAEEKYQENDYQPLLTCEENMKRTEVAHALLLLQCSSNVEHNHEQEAQLTESSQRSTIDAEVSTDLSTNHIHALEMDNNNLRRENYLLKEKLNASSLDQSAFADNDDKVLFYTGLPSWQILLCLYNYIHPFLSHSIQCALNPFQQLMLTMMRLRLDLSGKDLGFRFSGIHESTVSRIFLQVLNVLHQRLSPLIIWPDHEMLRKTMPMDFRKHCPNCTVIIDCFEIFLERSLNPLARAQTFSSYKHHNTVKYLIGITPQGTVSYISDGWGGRVSDKHLTENSGLLEKLHPGDVILADRGFDISDTVGLYCAQISIPAFTKGKKQLTGIEVEQTRRIANVRIHVERVIGNIRKKYSILSSTQPITFVMSKTNSLTTLDKIVTVSCALCNICNSVIPTD